MNVKLKCAEPASMHGEQACIDGLEEISLSIQLVSAKKKRFTANTTFIDGESTFKMVP
jgi:hypothetical protein